MTSLLPEIELLFMLNLALSLLAGFLIGLERESRGKDAGISTQSLVIMGAMLFTFISAHIEPDFTARIAAQVVMGVGFLGGGLILKEGKAVHNLTTAASLWYSAAIGMCFGFGFHVIGIFSTLIGVLVMRIPHIAMPRRDDTHA
ncbi:MAG TPA: MgtC/SapB family protein [Candidatus Paceibacterota bacterium]|nr:MgtC/SapB family protein [Candidatus Paceibacterota bacterium]